MGMELFNFRFRLIVTKQLQFFYRDKHIDSKIILWR